MRPVRMEMEGFTSFPKRVEIDFGGLDLFAITGPTGAGKTSILDAMLYALYGETPRIGTTEIPRLVSLGMQTVKVTLEFRSGGKLYRIARTRKAGKTSVTNILLEEHADGEWNSLSSNVKDIGERVKDILGLDFAGFTRSVILPQGLFDQFLRGGSKERTEILKDLLGLRVYERMMRAANERDKELRLKADMQEQQLSTAYADATEENLREQEAQIEEFSKQLAEQESGQARLNGLLPLAQDLKRIREEVSGAAAELSKARQELEKAVTDAGANERLAAACAQELAEVELALQSTAYDETAWAELMQAVPLARQQVKLQEELVSRRKERQAQAEGQPKLEADAKAAEENRTVAEEALEKAQQGAKVTAETCEEFQRRHGSADLIETAARELAAAARAAAEFPEEQAMKTAVARAEAEVDHLQTMHAALEIRQRLHDGEVCPVCEQVIGKTPPGTTLSPVSEAKAALKEAAGRYERWRAVHGQFVKAQERSDTIAGRAGASANDLEGLAERSRGLARDHAAAVGYLQTAQREAAAAAKAAQGTQQQLQLLRQQVAGMDAEIRKAQDKLREAAGALQAFPSWAPLPLSELDAALEEQNREKQRRMALERQRIETMKKQQKATAEGAELKSRQLSAQNRIGEKETQIASARAKEKEWSAGLRAQLPEMAPGMDEMQFVESGLRGVSALLHTLQGNRARAEERVQQINRRIAESALIRVEVAEKREKAAVYHSLGKLLAADEFIAYVQREALIRLAAAASDQLDMLSRGQYRLTLGPDKNEFFVVDYWNGSETRSVKTLSGGESFLASLALALALSEGLSSYSDERARSRLDSLFIDEGISSLDPESLEIAIGAIETLSSGKRMVGVISHVVELGERLPARIRVDKAQGGSKVTVEGSHSHSMVAGGL